jgi:lipase
VTLVVHAWGDPGAPAVVCLHGVTAHGARFRKLAEERLGRFRVLAPDLRGHGHSSWEPPWDADTHVADVIPLVEGSGVWLGHSFGGRLALEVAARHPERVEKLVLLDPAIRVLPHVALDLAEQERKDVSFASAEEAIQARLDSGRIFSTSAELLEEEMAVHLEPGLDGRLRFRYCRSAVIAAWSIMASEPPPFPRVPTLLVLGKRSWLLLDEQAAAYREALGDLLSVVQVPGGHTVLWDDFDATAEAIEDFLAG